MDRRLMNRAALLAPLLLLLASCAMVRGQLNREGALIDSAQRDWRQVATGNDRDRLRQWRTLFVEALRQARAAGAGGLVAAEGTLLAPDAALPGPALPSGAYRCRTFKLGAREAGLPAYRAGPAATCRIRPQRGLQGFISPAGPQRPIGVIFPGDRLRQVFLGTLIVGDERRALQYGGDPDRDMAGYVERIGPRRWRLILPRPRFESLIDVVELVPAA